MLRKGYRAIRDYTSGFVLGLGSIALSLPFLLINPLLGMIGASIAAAGTLAAYLHIKTDREDYKILKEWERREPFKIANERKASIAELRRNIQTYPLSKLIEVSREYTQGKLDDQFSERVAQAIAPCCGNAKGAIRGYTLASNEVKDKLSDKLREKKKIYKGAVGLLEKKAQLKEMEKKLDEELERLEKFTQYEEDVDRKSKKLDNLKERLRELRSVNIKTGRGYEETISGIGGLEKDYEGILKNLEEVGPRLQINNKYKSSLEELRKEISEIFEKCGEKREEFKKLTKPLKELEKRKKGIWEKLERSKIDMERRDEAEDIRLTLGEYRAGAKERFERRVLSYRGIINDLEWSQEKIEQTLKLQERVPEVDRAKVNGEIRKQLMQLKGKVEDLKKVKKEEVEKQLEEYSIKSKDFIKKMYEIFGEIGKGVDEIIKKYDRKLEKVKPEELSKQLEEIEKQYVEEEERIKKYVKENVPQVTEIIGELQRKTRGMQELAKICKKTIESYRKEERRVKKEKQKIRNREEDLNKKLEDYVKEHREELEVNTVDELDLQTVKNSLKEIETELERLKKYKPKIRVKEKAN